MTKEIPQNPVFITGGCGFIGSNFLTMVVPMFPDTLFVNIDKLTYAANPLSLKEIADNSNYRFERVDICDQNGVEDIFHRYQPDWVIHFAAESHVDRSIFNPKDFLETNVLGTFNLLEAARKHWKDSQSKLFHHVSTDEVYGSAVKGWFTEESRYDPSSPYSASKASSDHLVRAYHRTYALPIKITNCSNNYGPRQFPEKMIPLMIMNCIERKPLPIYGDGSNIRDWIYVEDHCRALLNVALNGRTGETYNIGGNCELNNLAVVQAVCETVAQQTGCSVNELQSLIQFVKDRPGHDWRYALDTRKIAAELGWQPQETFSSGLAKTVSWYLSHREWIDSIRTGEYNQWLGKNYDQRGK